MAKFLVRWGISSVALVLVAQLFSGVTSQNLTDIIVMALVLGLLNAFLKPLLTLLSLPFMVVTLGLFSFIINGLVFYLAAHLVSGFYVYGFWSAVWASILYSFLTFLINLLVYSEK